MGTQRDLREWLAQVQSWGELKVLEGSDWNLEIGGLEQLMRRKGDEGPALLFDRIKDHRPGYRVVTNAIGSIRRLAYTLGMETNLHPLEFMKRWHQRSQEIEPVPAKFVQSGPVFENRMEGDAVNLYAFPAPKWHPHDGGRYIGTGGVTITRDPDDGWVNLGTYRIMIHDRNHLSCYIAPGKHGRIHRDKYFARGENCPVAISFGHDPLVFVAGSFGWPNGASEYEFLGGITGAPYEVINGPLTGLPIPASAEIVAEGFIRYDQLASEGPFGEWTGYYGSSARAEPVIEVRSIYHRNDPIIMGRSSKICMRAINIWEHLERAGIPDVKGVWYHESGGSRLLLFISLKQRYPGHATQAAMIASQCRDGAYLGRYIVVVDEDIDVTNTHDVLWAIATRTDPVRDIQLLRDCWSGPLDPAIHPDEKGFSSRAIVDATRPFEWRDKFPLTCGLDEETKTRLWSKWRDQIDH